MIDLGPGAGVHGGNVVFEGTVNQILKDNKSVTGKYLKDNSLINLDDKIRNRSGSLLISKASENNLKEIDIEIPLGLFVSITGVSGSGKSTLINDVLLKTLQNHFYKSNIRPGSAQGHYRFRKY